MARPLSHCVSDQCARTRVLVPVQPRGVQDVDGAHVAAVMRLTPAEGAGNTCGGGGEGQGGEREVFWGQGGCVTYPQRVNGRPALALME